VRVEAKVVDGQAAEGGLEEGCHLVHVGEALGARRLVHDQLEAALVRGHRDAVPAAEDGYLQYVFACTYIFHACYRIMAISSIPRWGCGSSDTIRHSGEHT